MREKPVEPCMMAMNLSIVETKLWAFGVMVWGQTVHDGHKTVCCRFWADVGARISLRPVTEEVIDEGSFADRVLSKEENKRLGICRDSGFRKNMRGSGFRMHGLGSRSDNVVSGVDFVAS